ncbi:MAG: DNA repair exonuclease [Eubacterium sp.]|nr:DNA repair exonuclease [Eubacterium sp.]
MRFIHISDVYLGYQPDPGKEWSEDRAKELETTFLQVLADCNEKDVQLLLIAGNLFAAPPTEQQLAWLDEKLGTLEHTRTLFIAGSADYIAPGSPMETYQFQSKTVVFPREKTTNAYLKGVNTCVTGYSYGQPEHRENILDAIAPGRTSSFNILLAHGGDANHMPYHKGILAGKGFDYIAMGGSRRPVHILKNRMAYSGSPEPLSIQDQGKHGYILGEMTEQGTTITWCPIAKRAYIRFTFDLRPDISGEEVARLAEEKMMKMGYQNIYSIVMRGFASEDLKPDFTRLCKRFNIYEIDDQTMSVKEMDLLKVENGANLVGSFARELADNVTIDERIREKAQRYGMEALIRAGE